MTKELEEYFELNSSKIIMKLELLLSTMKMMKLNNDGTFGKVEAMNPTFVAGEKLTQRQIDSGHFFTNYFLETIEEQIKETIQLTKEIAPSLDKLKQLPPKFIIDFDITTDGKGAMSINKTFYDNSFQMNIEENKEEDKK